MSGILNNKSRIMDTIITDEGRRQLGTGQMQIEFVAYTDGATFYEPNLVSGAADVGNRIFFEAASLPMDQITFEADDSGKLLPFKNSDIELIYGQMVSGSFSGSTFLQTFITSSIASLASNLLSGSINSFIKQKFIATQDKFFNDEQFLLDEEVAKFEITDLKPHNSLEPTLSIVPLAECTVENAESLINDTRLANAINFQYLPPVNGVGNIVQADSINIGGESLIPTLKPLKVVDIDKIKTDLNARLTKLENNGYLQTIKFIDTSRTNNLLSQFFEIGESYVKKLDIIEFRQSLSPNSTLAYSQRVFFVGKVFVDTNGFATFINMFTLVFE